MEQVEGRFVHDLTVTQLNLFHIAELRIGVLNHRPYNVGWGHHHCNVVVKDAGILKTLEWMRAVVSRTMGTVTFLRRRVVTDAVYSSQGWAFGVRLKAGFCSWLSSTRDAISAAHSGSISIAIAWRSKFESRHRSTAAASKTI